MTRRRKLRILIITLGGERQQIMREQFEGHKDTVEIEFTDGVGSRQLRNRSHFLEIAHRVGLLPEAEYQAISSRIEKGACAPCADKGTTTKNKGDDFWACLSDVPVAAGRRGSADDVKLHYSVELWRKAKTLNRNRAVLACTFAHLIALRKLVEEQFDLVLEDNVRIPKQGLVDRVWRMIEHRGSCDMCYFGWLGSVTNLTWIYESYFDNHEGDLAPLPTLGDLERDMKNKTIDNSEQQPGGNLVWGAYAYWISRKSYENIMTKLRNDVGSLLWRSKKMRFYAVKPIDKILPRTIETFGSIQIPENPLFFRAPMLTSKIHTQWDPSFCESTEFELLQSGLHWSDLKLTETEQQIVQYAQEHMRWITPAELKSLRLNEKPNVF